MTKDFEKRTKEKSKMTGHHPALFSKQHFYVRCDTSTCADLCEVCSELGRSGSSDTISPTKLTSYKLDQVTVVQPGVVDGLCFWSEEGKHL